MSFAGLGWTALSCLAYYYVVRVAGPRFMANRPPFRIRRILMAYNLFQVLFNAYIFYEIAMSGWLTGGYNLLCQPVDYSETDETAQRTVRACWLFFMSKFIDFLDTIFFVLRKKNNQISSLHVYHHGTIALALWPGVRYVPGGNTTFCGLLNSLIHVFMYFYYLVSAMGPQYQKFVWWKKYLTTMQLIQFALILLHSLQHVLGSNPCNYPKMYSLWFMFNAVVFFVLFTRFYRKAYSSSKAARQAANDELHDDDGVNKVVMESNGTRKRSNVVVRNGTRV